MNDFRILHTLCLYLPCLAINIQVPRESLLFVIPAFGGTVSWEGEGAPFEESDQSITHQVCEKTHLLVDNDYNFFSDALS